MLPPVGIVDAPGIAEVAGIPIPIIDARSIIMVPLMSDCSLCKVSSVTFKAPKIPLPNARSKANH